jgi:hypothetical protein
LWDKSPATRNNSSKGAAPQKRGNVVRNNKAVISRDNKPGLSKEIKNNKGAQTASKSKYSVQLRQGAEAGGIPRTAGMKGLHNGKQKKDQIQRRLKNKSPWYQSIIDPLHGADCKIPDSTGVETGTLQLVQRVALTVPANGTTGLRTSCLHPNKYSTGFAHNFQPLSDVIAGVVYWGTPAAFDTQDPLAAYSQGVRVVSASIFMQSEASLATNGGVFTGYNIPIDQVLSSALTVDDYQNQYKASLIPINNNEPVIVRWYPVKKDGWAYDQFYEASAASISTESAPWNELGVIISGASVGAVYEATIVVNYEFIPHYNAINILDASPSPSDAMETDLVENWVQEMDVSTITTNKKMATSPSSVQPSHDDDVSGFGMFFNVIAELAPLALGLLL